MNKIKRYSADTASEHEAGCWVKYDDYIEDKAVAVKDVKSDRDWYRRTLEEIDRECSFTENEGLKRIRSMARAVLYPMPEEKK